MYGSWNGPAPTSSRENRFCICCAKPGSKGSNPFRAESGESSTCTVWSVQTTL